MNDLHQIFFLKVYIESLSKAVTMTTYHHARGNILTRKRVIVGQITCIALSYWWCYVYWYKPIKTTCLSFIIYL